jgi:hypothetical protein
MRWEFKQEPGDTQRWRWQYVDDQSGSVLRMSPTLFSNLADCVSDAEKNGYDATRGPVRATAAAHSNGEP